MDSDNKGSNVGCPLTSCATLDKLNNLTVPQFLIYLIGEDQSSHICKMLSTLSGTW